MRGRNPFDEIERFFERMSDQFEESAEWPARMRRDAAVDLLDRGDEYEVVVDVPGFERDEIELTLTEDTLRIRAERDEHGEGGGAGESEDDEVGASEDDERGGGGETVRYVRQERHAGSVERTVSLPDAVDQESASATLADGVLRVTLTKQGLGEDSTTIDIE